MFFDTFVKETTIICDNMGELFFIAWARTLRPPFKVLDSVPSLASPSKRCGLECSVCKRFAQFKYHTEEEDVIEAVESEGWTRDCYRCDEFIFHAHCCPRCYVNRLCPDCTKEVNEITVEE